jgi:hypothetical protein
MCYKGASRSNSVCLSIRLKLQIPLLNAVLNLNKSVYINVNDAVVTPSARSQCPENLNELFIAFLPQGMWQAPSGRTGERSSLHVGPAHNAKLHLTVALSRKRCAVPIQHHAMLTLKVAPGIVQSLKVRDNPSKAEQPQNRFIIRIKQ